MISPSAARLVGPLIAVFGLCGLAACGEEGEARNQVDTDVRDAVAYDDAADAEADAATELDLMPDAAPDAADADSGPQLWAPEERGPFAVGHREITLRDDRFDPPESVAVGVWYPTDDSDGTVARILFTETGAFSNAGVSSSAPFPLVMFSHGNQGANAQSFTLCEHLASHGFVVASPDHTGNQIADSPSDEEMAAIAARRPEDVMRAMAAVEGHADIGPAVSGTGRAVMGHSFGGYTALVLAGAEVDVDGAITRCEAGSESDVMCPFMPYWPDDAPLTRPAAASVFEAVVALAPGGYSAFGDEGLASVAIPAFLMGGTEDEFTASEIGPIFEALPSWTLSLLIEGGGHLMFTDICRLPFAQSIPELAALCDPDGRIAVDRGHLIVNTFATAFLRHILLGDAEMVSYLRSPPTASFPEATLMVRNAPD